MDSIAELLKIMQNFGATRFYAKKLSPNDNSKNQLYLGGNFSALNIIPYDKVYIDETNVAGSKRSRSKADILFYWVDKDGKYKAPNAQMILYPEYPEVRMSGLLQGCEKAPSEIISKRDEGRLLFFGINNEGEVLGYATDASHPLAIELNRSNDWNTHGVFIEIPFDASHENDTKKLLLKELQRIYQKRWISSQKMRSDRTIEAYSARNGGGYTLEAELGISPNSYAEADYMGWEVKQYGVRDFISYKPKSPLTLMTPEPTGGLYKEQGVESFLRKFGYADKSGIDDRFNFGGVYKCDKDFHGDTGLRLIINGYDIPSGKIIDMSGGIVLLSKQDEVAAIWHFASIMKHWNQKHAQAAYIPSIFQTPPPEYSYGARIELYENTDFLLFLKAIASGVIYYDPSIKIENASDLKPKIKRRNQFRIKHSLLDRVYGQKELFDLVNSF